MARAERVTTMSVLAHVTGVIRDGNTTNGNPRWKLVTGVGVWRTVDDAQVNFDVSESLTAPQHQPVELHLRNGKVVGLTRAGDRR